MSCCGGGTVYQPPTIPRAVTGVAAPQKRRMYRVTTPQGIVYEYEQPWKARQVQAMRGGSLEIIEPDDGPGGSS